MHLMQKRVYGIMIQHLILFGHASPKSFLKKILNIQKLMDSEKLQPTLNQAINWIIEIHRLGRFLPICGNGCLAADARDNPLGVDRNVS